MSSITIPVSSTTTTPQVLNFTDMTWVTVSSILMVFFVRFIHVDF